MLIHCIIVDDEPLALNLLKDYVQRTPFLELTAACSNGVDALRIINEQKVDLAFLDIQMPELNGLELSKMLQDCAIVFTTAFEQYAIEGFKVNAMDYLLKPFAYPEFLAAAQKAHRWVEMRCLAESAKQQTVDTASSQEANPQTYTSLVVKSSYRQVVIQIDQIVYIESVRDYLDIHLDSSETINTLMSMKQIESLLPPQWMVRVHRSFMVNLHKIRIMENNRIVFGKTYIPISDSYRENFNRLFSILVPSLQNRNDLS